MKLIRQTLAIGLAAAVTMVAACSSSPKQAGPTASNSVNTPGSQNAGGDSTGALGLQLTLPGGEHISKVSYILSNSWNNPTSQNPTANPGPGTVTGSYNIAAANNLSFVIGNVPADNNYKLQVTASSDEMPYPSVTCSFPSADNTVTNISTESAITIVNRTTTVVNINLQCVDNQNLDAGSLLVNATQSNCPVWTTIVANPINIVDIDAGYNVNPGVGGTQGATAFQNGASTTAIINDGQQLVLVGAASAPDPGNLTFAWTSTCGTITNPAGMAVANGTNDPNSNDGGAANQAVFQCPAAPSATQTCTVKLTVADGPVPAPCDTNFTVGTVQVQCVNPAPCGGKPYASVTTNAIGLCTNQNTGGNTDPVTGAYWVPGTADPANPADICCVPACGGVASAESSTYPTGTCPAATPLNTNGCCSALLPCTTLAQASAGQCVKCGGSANGVCTATEALLVARDIAKGYVAAPGTETNSAADSNTKCYSCMFAAGGLDDTLFSSDVNHECADPVITTPTLNGETGSQACLDTLSCIITNAAATANPPSYAFCGSAAGSACLTAGAANGPCLGKEINGLDIGTYNAGTMTYTEGDPTASQKAYTNSANASGQANALMGFAFSNCKAQCTP